jgi:PmbA protein
LEADIMEIAEYIVKRGLNLGADDIIATVINSNTKQIRFANNEIFLSTEWETVDVEVFLSVGKRLISSSLKNPSPSETFLSVSKDWNLTKENIDKFLARMIKMAKMIKPKEDYYGIASGNFKYGKLKDCYDKRITKLSEENIDFVHEAINAALSEGAKRCAGVLYSSVYTRYKYTSNGISAREKGTRINISIRAFREKDESAHSVSVSRVLKYFDPEKAGKEAGEMVNEYKNPVAGSAGKYDIIFSPMFMANLFNYMSYAFSAFEVDSGMSFLIGELGKGVANNNVTIIDDGRLPNGFGSVLFDEEGRPTKTTKIIDRGILKTYLHNTSTAKKFNAEPTGNAGIVYPSFWNLVLEKGDSSLEEMISEIKNGLYLTNTWYTRFRDHRAGDFSTIPRDAIFEIKNGKLGKPIKGIRLSDNMKNILKNIQLISKERKQIQWWEAEKPVLAGWVLCKGLNITKSSK